jgi:hypothetical protein
MLKVLNPFHASSNTYYGRMEPIVSTLPAQYEAGSGLLMEVSIVGNISLVQCWTTFCCSNIPTKTQKVLNSFRALSNTYYGRMEPIVSSLTAQYQAGSCHSMETSIVGNMSLVQYWTTPAAVTFQPRPRKC